MPCYISCSDAPEYGNAVILYITTKLAREPISLVVGPEDRGSGTYLFRPTTPSQESFSCKMFFASKDIEATNIKEACMHYIESSNIRSSCDVVVLGYHEKQ